MAFTCVNCGNNRFKQTSAIVSRHIAGHEFQSTIPTRECTSCGMKYYASDDLARFELATAITIANAALQVPEALKFMRKVTGLQAKQFADLLGVRPETVSRWESGKTPVDRATYSVLQQFLLDGLAGSSATEKGLRVLMRPRRLQKRVVAEDVALAKILDRFGDRDGPRWMGDVEPYWINRLVQRGFLKPLVRPTLGRNHDITDAGREFADRVLNRRHAA
jgi:putative zinc finger/helix-turn-helix YgiT family protein